MLKTITIVGIKYNRLFTKTESTELAHLALKHCLESIQKLRKQFDDQLKVFADFKNKTYDARKEFEEAIFDIFKSF